ncbi:polysaccharide pyruvyl transferase family protein [Phenylobacterium sp.]|uniref:polysaccharide pyruvyl transferase family protein n=1 Tax=Phenylobacterium sp. TaxID=1871053 RepID=UPI00301E2491
MGQIKIGLLWHCDAAGNLGVGALTVGNIASARQAAQRLGVSPQFTLLQFPGDLAHPYVSGPDIRTFNISRRSLQSPGGYWRELADLDCILDIGAGDSFADIYGSTRFAFMILTKELAFLRGKPLLLSPQTIGPFSRQPYKALARRALVKAHAVVARDPESMAALTSLAPRARGVQSIDVAFRLPFTPPAPRKEDVLEIGVNVSGLLYNGGYGGGNDYGLEVDYAELMRRFIRHHAARSDARVHLVCHVLSERLARDDDARVADVLAQEFPTVVRAPNFRSPEEAKSYIAGLDFLVAGRMHACIAAYSAGVPVAPIAYSRKFSGLFSGALGYDHLVPVRGMSTDMALEFLNDRLTKREALRQDIAVGSGVVAQGLATYDAVLEEFFSRALAR